MARSVDGLAGASDMGFDLASEAARRIQDLWSAASLSCEVKTVVRRCSLTTAVQLCSCYLERVADRVIVQLRTVRIGGNA